MQSVVLSMKDVDYHIQYTFSRLFWFTLYFSIQVSEWLKITTESVRIFLGDIKQRN